MPRSRKPADTPDAQLTEPEAPEAPDPGYDADRINAAVRARGIPTILPGFAVDPSRFLSGGERRAAAARKR